MPIESEGNTSLIYDGSKMSAIYQDRTIDLWNYAIEVEGYLDDIVGWETDKKNFLVDETSIYSWHAEVINNKGILVIETTNLSEPQYYFAWEFSLNDGWVHSWIVEEPSGKYGSYKFRGDYPEDEYLVKAPDGSKFYFIHPEVYPKYIQLGGSREGTDFLRVFDQVINPVSLSELIDKKIVSPSVDINSYLTIGTEFLIEDIKDFDGNLHASKETSSDELKSAYKYQGLIDVNKDGINEAIFTNKISGRWATASVESFTGTIDLSKYGEGGTTRVVGIYIDPLVTSGEVEQFGPHDSQRRFQNDLLIDNLTVKTSGDYDNDGFQEVYWKTNDGTAYLRALMHDDGNIQYANYQSETQMREYLTSNGDESVISDIV